ncbi:MAG: hypothetical protein ACPLKZ_07150 [Candidatus Bathyarchaeales archaeon]
MRLFPNVIIIILLLTATLGASFVNYAGANPIWHEWKKEGKVAAPTDTLPPEILILSPMNNTSYASNNVSLTFNVTIPKSNKSSFSISEVYYRTSWQRLAKISINFESTNGDPRLSINMTNIPEGPHWLEVYATATGFGYWTRNVTDHLSPTPHIIHYYVDYRITGSAMVNFTIDTQPPIISTLSVENKTYHSSNITLNVIVNEPISQVIYSLDGQRNITISGNTTLTNLLEGEHNLTVYVVDPAGNVGTIKTVYFSVDLPESIPITLIAVSAASAAVTGTVILKYVRKRKH